VLNTKGSRKTAFYVKASPRFNKKAFLKQWINTGVRKD